MAGPAIIADSAIPPAKFAALHGEFMQSSELAAGARRLRYSYRNLSLYIRQRH
jgi:hypothetical protein